MEKNWQDNSKSLALIQHLTTGRACTHPHCLRNSRIPKAPSGYQVLSGTYLEELRNFDVDNLEKDWSSDPSSESTSIPGIADTGQPIVEDVHLYLDCEWVSGTGLYPRATLITINTTKSTNHSKDSGNVSPLEAWISSYGGFRHR